MAKLSATQVSTFLVCSKQPSRKMLKALNFAQGPFLGVQVNTNTVSARITLISLNELSNASHNVAFKLFASRAAVRNNAFEQLNSYTEGLPEEAFWFARALKCLHRGSENTEAEIIEIGKIICKSALRRASIDEHLEGIPANDLIRS